jgi:hypothetical protein
MPITPLSEILSWPKGKRIGADAELSLYDVGGMRWNIIAEILKRKPDALVAIDSLGQMTHPVSRETMLPVIQSLQLGPAQDLNKLVGIVDGALIRRAALRDRIVILWLLHDMQLRARIASQRIKEERALRRGVAETEITSLERSRVRFERIDRLVDEVEPAYNRRDRMRPKPSLYDDIRELRNYYDQFRSGKPMWCGILGVDWRVGDTIEAAIALGNRSALGAFTVTTRALIGQRHDRLIASVAGAVLRSTITARVTRTLLRNVPSATRPAA